RHTRFSRDWSSDVCSSDLAAQTVRRIADPYQRADRLTEMARAAVNARALESAERIAQGVDEPSLAARVQFAVARAVAGAGDFEGSEERRVGSGCGGGGGGG